MQIEHLIVATALLLFIAYAIIHFFLWRGLSNCNKPTTSTQHSFSIVVAARNEEVNIARLLESLIHLEYPKEKFEIIIVNDRSTDSTHALIEKYSATYSLIKSVTITENTSDLPNKKHALSVGISLAKNDIIALTDADCIVPSTWLTEISQQFTDDVGVVAGYSPYTVLLNNNFLNSFLWYEELKNSVMAAAAAGLAAAYMCTGRNFSYRKKVYEEVGGFEKIKRSISGDDDLFLQLVQQETQWNIRYMTSPQSFVYTKPPANFAQFVHQRVRHISASKFYPTHIKIAFGIYHLCTVFALLLSIVNLPMGAAAFIFKINIDALLIAKGSIIFSEKISFTEFVKNELLLILYYFGIGPLGITAKFEWKGARS